MTEPVLLDQADALSRRKDQISLRIAQALFGLQEISLPDGTAFYKTDHYPGWSPYPPDYLGNPYHFDRIIDAMAERGFTTVIAFSNDPDTKEKHWTCQFHPAPSGRSPVKTIGDSLMEVVAVSVHEAILLGWLDND